VLSGSPFTTYGACASPTYCVALGTAYTEDGSSGQFIIAGDPATITSADAQEVTSSVYLSSVACTGPARCVAVGSGPSKPLVLVGDPASFGTAHGREFTLGQSLGKYGTLVSVACPLRTYCVALGSTLNLEPFVVTGNPSTWNAHSAFPLRVAAGKHLASISCRSAHYCVVVGGKPGAPIYVTGNPARWKSRFFAHPAHRGPFMGMGLTSTACTPARCFAGGYANGGDFVATLK
jgi:hypothetical protein